MVDDVAAAHHVHEGQGALWRLQPLGDLAQHEAGDGGQIQPLRLFQRNPGDLVQFA